MCTCISAVAVRNRLGECHMYPTSGPSSTHILRPAMVLARPCVHAWRSALLRVRRNPVFAKGRDTPTPGRGARHKRWPLRNAVQLNRVILNWIEDNTKIVAHSVCWECRADSGRSVLLPKNEVVGTFCTRCWWWWCKRSWSAESWLALLVPNSIRVVVEYVVNIEVRESMSTIKVQHALIKVTNRSFNLYIIFRQCSTLLPAMAHTAYVAGHKPQFAIVRKRTTPTERYSPF